MNITTDPNKLSPNQLQEERDRLQKLLDSGEATVKDSDRLRVVEACIFSIKSAQTKRVKFKW